MSTIKRRLAKLEGAQTADDLAVTIYTWSGEGEFVQVKSASGSTVARDPNESEESFLSRASDELVASEKKNGGHAPFVMWALRDRGEEKESDFLKQKMREAAPSLRPELSRDEWLIAHGLQPVGDFPK
jgi:hypothetical protein